MCTVVGPEVFFTNYFLLACIFGREQIASTVCSSFNFWSVDFLLLKISFLNPEKIPSYLREAFICNILPKSLITYTLGRETWRLSIITVSSKRLLFLEMMGSNLPWKVVRIYKVRPQRKPGNLILHCGLFFFLLFLFWQASVFFTAPLRTLDKIVCGYNWNTGMNILTFAWGFKRHLKVKLT